MQKLREELAHEIEDIQMEFRAKDATHLTKIGKHKLQRREDEKEAKKAFFQFIIQLQKCARSERETEALLLLFDANEDYIEQAFSELKPMGTSRLLLCVGRYIIHQLIEKRSYSRALYYIEQCQQEVEFFVLAHPEHTLLMAKIAMDNHQYKLAFHLVSQAWERYGQYADIKKCALLEIELLSQCLNRPEQARERIAQLKGVADGLLKQDMAELEKILL